MLDNPLLWRLKRRPVHDDYYYSAWMGLTGIIVVLASLPLCVFAIIADNFLILCCFPLLMFTLPIPINAVILPIVVAVISALLTNRSVNHMDFDLIRVTTLSSSEIARALFLNVFHYLASIFFTLLAIIFCMIAVVILYILAVIFSFFTGGAFPLYPFILLLLLPPVMMTAWLGLLPFAISLGIVCSLWGGKNAFWIAGVLMLLIMGGIIFEMIFVLSLNLLQQVIWLFVQSIFTCGFAFMLLRFAEKRIRPA